MAAEGVNQTQRRAHVLTLTLEEQGHFTVFLQMLYYLSGYNIRVTVCSTKQRTEELANLQSKGAFKNLDLRLEDVFSESDPETRPMRVRAVPALWRTASKMDVQFRPYLAKLVLEKDPDARPTFLLADQFLNWAQEVAETLDIPRYVMVTASAWAPLSVMWGEVDEWNSKPVDKYVTLPGLSAVRIRGNIPLILAPLVNFKNAAGILCNSFEELEKGMTDAARAHLRKYPTSTGQVTKFLPIGPMLNLPGYPKSSQVENGATSCLDWLDSQAPSSVLYVAFGTQAMLEGGTILEIAHGLEASSVPFLWALRLSPEVKELSSILPPGFQERMKYRGLIETKFAPQLQILNHSSTGAFLSHCGWNSTMESICAGVPVLAHPMHGDQPLNARILEEITKTGIIIPKLWDGACVRDNISTSIRSVMLEERGLELRKNADYMKKIALATQEEGSSSKINLQYFMQDVLASASVVKMERNGKQ